MKTKLRFLFHKPIGERGVGKAIVAWTWLLGCFYNWKLLKYNFSHMELWLPLTLNFGNLHWLGFKDDYYIEGITNRYQGQCFSSTTRGNANGVRFAPASEVLKHPERWEYIEVEVDTERLEVAEDEATLLIGRKYDYAALFGFLQPFDTQNEKKWYCSEICMWFAHLVRATKKRHKRISPRRAAYILAKLYHEPKPI